MLNRLGAHIDGIGSNTLAIQGVSRLWREFTIGQTMEVKLSLCLTGETRSRLRPSTRMISFVLIALVC
jgi:UDP-N-acetylglucosamine enolpyruvyl transferase